MTELHAYDSIIKRGVIRAGPCIYINQQVTFNKHKLSNKLNDNYCTNCSISCRRATEELRDEFRLAAVTLREYALPGNFTPVFCKNKEERVVFLYLPVEIQGRVETRKDG